MQERSKMTSAQVLDSKGNKVREIGLDDDVFGITPNEGLLHTALIRQLANGRSGSANTKTRSEVRGGGKKPWRQKGTGRARAGSIRSPLWEGGGVIFGPKPRDFSIALPKKQRVLALKSALAV
jgi:large subunit ribosomal protein L4